MGIFKKVIHHEISVMYDEIEGLRFIIAVLERRGIPWRVTKFGSHGERATIKFDTNTRSQYKDIMAEVDNEIRRVHKGIPVNVEVIEE